MQVSWDMSGNRLGYFLQAATDYLLISSPVGKKKKKEKKRQEHMSLIKKHHLPDSPKMCGENLALKMDLDYLFMAAGNYR